MADPLTVNVKGAGLIQHRLAQISDRTARRVLVAAVRSGAVEMRKAGKRAAPVRRVGGVRRLTKRSGRVRAPGFLSRRVIYRRVRGRNVFAFRVGPAREAFYGLFVEKGRGGRRPLRPRPWLRPAWHANRLRVFRAIVKGFDKAFSREARRGHR